MKWSGQGILQRLEHAVARAVIDVRSRVDSGSDSLDGQTLDSEVRAMLYAMKLSGYTSLSAGGIQRARARMRRDAQVHAGVKTHVKSVRDITIQGGQGPLRARHYAPDEPGGPHPLIVFFHGGGFALGDLDTHDEPCRVLCRHAGVHVLSVDYRLAPEHVFPAGAEDALAALRWAQRHAVELGADPRRIGVAGDSAGGNLATVACLLAAKAGDPLPQLQLLIYPCTDSSKLHPSRDLFAEGFFLTQADIEFFTRTYLGGFDDRSDLRVSPLCAAQLPHEVETLLITAGFDPLRDEGEAYAERLRAAGGKVAVRRERSLIHGFLNMGGLSRVSRDTTRQLALSARAAFARMRPT